MNKLEQLKVENYKKYHTQGMPNYARPKINVIFISIANSLKHELKKLEICYKLRKDNYSFITEAVEIISGLKRDVICLETNEIYEIENSKSKRGHRHSGNINVVWYG